MYQRTFSRYLSATFRRPVLLLIALTCLTIVPALWSKDVWYIDESRHAAVFVNLVENGHWLVLYLGETIYPDKPPVYFWLVGLLYLLFQTTDPELYKAAAGVSGLFLVLTSWYAAKRLGFHRNVAIVAGLLVLSNHYILTRMHMPRMDLLFVTFIFLSQLYFFLAIEALNKKRQLYFLAAFLLAALAVLTKGPLGGLLSISSALTYMLVRRRSEILRTREFWIGTLGLIVPCAAYLLGSYYYAGTQYLEQILYDQTVYRGLSWPGMTRPIYTYIPMYVWNLLPFTFILLFLPWKRWSPKKLLAENFDDWQPGSLGALYVATCFLVSFVLLSIIPYKSTFASLTALPQLIVLMAWTLFRVSEKRRLWLFTTIVIYQILLVMFLPFADNLTRWPEYIEGKWQVTFAAALGVLIVLALRKSSVRVFVLGISVGLIVATLPYFTITIPGLDPVMSPRRATQDLLALERDGCSIMLHHDYRRGTLDYHAGKPIPFSPLPEQVLAARKDSACVGVIMHKRNWKRSSDKFAEGEVVGEYIFDYERMMLVRFAGTKQS